MNRQEPEGLGYVAYACLDRPDRITHIIPTLRKRYQRLLIEHLKERIRKEPSSDTPDSDLMVFSEPSTMKGFFDDRK
uniref:Transposase n=1 Tax=Candidatus Kentrum sp. TC TaxID=2126339 RepID=A0A450YR40_9GAMM|nr:MAG: hypothetical protein BECKTC1821E_GA0114239_103029 [Candidatus Kentron sp. TC]